MSGATAPGDDLPQLPAGLHDQVFALLFGAGKDRRAAFEALLAAHPEHGPTLQAHWRHYEQLRRAAGERTGAGAGAADGDGGDDGTAIPGYRLLEVLGEGGMGTVWRAEQLQPVRRLVALKVIKPGMDSRAVLARFEQERQALAAMDHDAIAKVFDCGTSSRGQPFFAMELVEGLPLHRYCDERRLSLRDRLLLFAQVCAGVQHAHQKGVIHRDLKPGNILVADQGGGRHAVKIIDFGVARATDRRLAVGSLFTEVGMVLGTPEYMSPEQAAGETRRIDTRTDVYSLGVILYQLLVGALPFPAEQLRAAVVAEIQRMLREDEPPKPSTRLSRDAAEATAHAALRQVSAETLRRELAGDLDWVVLKAMAKEPERRYASATALAEDLQRYLQHEPLQAGPPSAAYRLRKLVRRHGGRLVAVGMVFVTAVAGAIVALRFALREQAKVWEYDQLAAVLQLDEALEAQPNLYPPWPRQIPALEQWVDRDVARLLARRPEVEVAVRELEARARPDPAAPPPGEPTAPRRLQFVSEGERYLHHNLSKLLPRLAALAGRQQVHARQLAWARQVEAASLSHPSAPHAWAEARAAIAKADDVVASRRYAGQRIELRDQDVIGLVPIGRNPVTGLWEFYDLRSAWDGTTEARAIPIPRHQPDGRITVTDATGIVFVLLPGGRFRMGAQKADKALPNHDPDSLGMEEPVREVELAPFFVARHELTQGQWARLWTGNDELRLPSQYQAGTTAFGQSFTLAHPVERVDWAMGNRLLTECGMRLPTEAQWEYAARAGTSEEWYCTLEELPRHANLLDATARKEAPNWVGSFEAWTDGFTAHAPVGSFGMNAFGLHDVYGNVWEWALDRYAGFRLAPRAGDGLREAPAAVTARVMRGGGFGCDHAYARSALRRDRAPTIRDSGCGLRAARALRPQD